MSTHHAVWLHFKVFRLALSYLTIVLPLHTFPPEMYGQVQTNISSDGTLGTAVSQIGNVHHIDGGMITGPNQFHSFDQFSVGTGDIASFHGPNGIENILSRVTGGMRSDIDGILHSSIDGANLFLLNPAGVLFGPNARLNLSGSFYVSTADFLQFEDGMEFHTDLEQDGVLSTAPVEAFGFLGESPAGITINQSALAVSEGQTLSVTAGDIETHGNPFFTQQFIPTLSAPGGQVHLVSFDSPGEISLSQEGAEVKVSAAQHGKITLAPNTLIDVDGIPEFAGGNGRGGTVVIRSGRLMIDNATISSTTIGSLDGASTAIDIQITNDVEVTNGARLSTGTFLGVGNAGDVKVQAENVTISDEALILSFTNGPGDAGDLSIITKEIITVDGSDLNGNGLKRPTGLFSSVENGAIRDNEGNVVFITEVGNAGAISVTAKNVTMQNGGAINSITNGPGNGGAVHITANETITLSGANPNSLVLPSGILSSAAEGVILDNEGNVASIVDVGDAGGVTVTAKNVSIKNGAVVTSITNGPGNGGNVRITGNESMIMSDNNPQSFSPTGILSTAGNGEAMVLDGNVVAILDVVGNAGDIQIEAGNVVVTGGATIDSSTLGPGEGGSLKVVANRDITLSGSGETSNGTITSGLHAVSGGVGDAGDIAVKAKNVTIKERAEIDTSTTGPGKGGSITVVATDTVTVSGLGLSDRGLFQGGVFSTSQGVGAGAGGEITVTANQVALQPGAGISARSTGVNDAGEINITATDAITLNDASIVTSADIASGGNIKLTADQSIQLLDSTIEAKVEGNELTTGGTISLDPQFITLQNSQLLATAVSGTGGSIELIGNVVLVDPLSTINASSQFGVSGSVNIRAPVQNLSGTIAPLPENLLQITIIMTARCAAQKDGELSSFIQSGRDTLPLEPEDFLASPTFLENPGSTVHKKDQDYSSEMFARRLGFTQPRKALESQNTFSLLSSFASPHCAPSLSLQ